VEQDILLVYFDDVVCKPYKPDWLIVLLLLANPLNLIDLFCCCCLQTL